MDWVGRWYHCALRAGAGTACLVTQWEFATCVPAGGGEKEGLGQLCYNLCVICPYAL